MRQWTRILAAWCVWFVVLVFAPTTWAYGPVTLQDAATATGVGTAWGPIQDTFTYQTIQVTIAGTATVQCQGSLDGTTYETVGTVTATGSCITEGAWKYIRANISACTACTVTAKAVLGQ